MYIVSTGSYLPGRNQITNEMLAEVFGEAVNLIGDYFGVKSRYFAVDYRSGDNVIGENNSDFCLNATKEALERSQIKIEDIDLIISSTNTPDYSLPQTSVLVQEKLGLKNAITLDIRGGCASSLQGMLIAENFIKGGLVENAIIMGSECFSSIYYPYLLRNKTKLSVRDLMNCLIFGDGAAAVIISKNKIGNNFLAIEEVVSQSSFSDWPSGFIVAWGGSKVRQDEESEISLGRGMVKHFPKEIESHLLEIIKIVIEKIQSEKGYEIKDFKYLIGPQANKRLINSLNRAFENTNYFYEGDVTGNVPGGALLLALDRLLKGHKLAEKDKILILGIESPKWIYGYCILNKVLL